VKTISDKVVRHSPYYPYKNDWWGQPLVPETLGQTINPVNYRSDFSLTYSLPGLQVRCGRMHPYG